MKDKLDVSGLREEDIHALEQLIELFKAKEKVAFERDSETISFAAWPLGVKGNLSRREIYEDF